MDYFGMRGFEECWITHRPQYRMMEYSPPNKADLEKRLRTATLTLTLARAKGRVAVRAAREEQEVVRALLTEFESSSIRPSRQQRQLSQRPQVIGR